jgi:hypothetical protein
MKIGKYSLILAFNEFCNCVIAPTLEHSKRFRAKHKFTIRFSPSGDILGKYLAHVQYFFRQGAE